MKVTLGCFSLVFQKFKEDLQRIRIAIQTLRCKIWSESPESACQDMSAVDEFLSSSASSISPLPSFMYAGFMDDTITSSDKLSCYTPLPSFMHDTDKLFRQQPWGASTKTSEEVEFGYFYASRPIGTRQAMEVSPARSIRPPQCDATGHNMYCFSNTVITASTTSRPDEEDLEFASFEMVNPLRDLLQNSRAVSLSKSGSNCTHASIEDLVVLQLPFAPSVDHAATSGESWCCSTVWLPFSKHTALEQPSPTGGGKSALSAFQYMHANRPPLRFSKKKVHSVIKQRSLLSDRLQGSHTLSFSKVEDPLPVSLRLGVLWENKVHLSRVMKDAPKVDMPFENPNQHVLFW